MSAGPQPGPQPALPFEDDLLSRVEDAGLNASAPPQQRWFDGWLLRFTPGKARRSRCITPKARGEGLATMLCKRLLSLSINYRAPPPEPA